MVAFAGDDRNAASKITLPIAVSGDAQLYVQDAGVRIPGLNEPPQATTVMLGAASPLQQVLAKAWPALSGWPVALVLGTVWSLYILVGFLVTRIARAGEETA